MSGRLSVTAFTALAAQHRAIYAALEDLGRRIADQPGAEAQVRPELERTAALTKDLHALTGDAAAPPVLASTDPYVERLDTLDDLAGCAAHAYAHDLDSITGGPANKQRMQRHSGR